MNIWIECTADNNVLNYILNWFFWNFWLLINFYWTHWAQENMGSGLWVCYVKNSVSKDTKRLFVICCPLMVHHLEYHIIKTLLWPWQLLPLYCSNTKTNIGWWILFLITAIKRCLSEFGIFSFGRAHSSQPTPYQVLVSKDTSWSPGPLSPFPTTWAENMIQLY